MSVSAGAIDPSKAQATVNAWDIPSYRRRVAKAGGAIRRLAIVTHGGLGDVLCAEPTIRYACEVLRDQRRELDSVTVISQRTEIFRHLADVELIEKEPNGRFTISGGAFNKYHFAYAGRNEDALQHHFFAHNTMQCVDHPALSALQIGLPIAYKQIRTSITPIAHDLSERHVAIHAGNHWKSKTFPKWYWDEILAGLKENGITPVLIGGLPNTSGVGTVDVDSRGCLDLRGNLTIDQSAYVLTQTRVLLTNDSFPLHLASIGSAAIGFFATAKNPEYLMHWRKDLTGKMDFGWRMKNLALGGAYERTQNPRMPPEEISEAKLEEVISWLPKAKSVSDWATAIIDDSGSYRSPGNPSPASLSN